MDSTQSLYSSKYSQGISDGFSVIDAWDYFSARHECSQISCITPFIYEGKNLTGTAIVFLDPLNDSSLRNFSSCMFTSDDGHNIEDISEQKSGSRDYEVYDLRIQGFVSYKDVLDDLGQFAAAASFYPHVEVRGEYELKRSVYHLLGDKAYDPSGIDHNQTYEEYLDDCITDMIRGKVFVGSRTLMSDLIAPDSTYISGNERSEYYSIHASRDSSVIRSYVKYVKDLSNERYKSASNLLPIAKALTNGVALLASYNG